MLHRSHPFAESAKGWGTHFLGDSKGWATRPLLKKVIIVFDLADIKSCVQGVHILPLLHRRYVEVTTGAANLALL